MAQDVHKLLSYAHQFEMVMGTRTTRELIWQAANMTWFLQAGETTLSASVFRCCSTGLP